jgi:ABC-type transport system involved in cytochrome c biogenesis permease subunit
MTVSFALSIAAMVSLASAVAAGLAGLLRPAVLAPETVPRPGGRSVGSASRESAIAQRLVELAALLLIGSLVALSIGTARPPWTDLGETAVAFGAAVLIAYLGIARATANRGLAVPVSLLAIGLVGYGLAIATPERPLQPALQQPLLLTVHVGMAIASYGVGAVAFLAAACEIVQRQTNGAVPLLPSAAVARRVAQQAVVIAFPLLTAAIVLGSVWANLAWRSYWNNDPKELAAAATWLVYAAELHVAGRRDRWGAAAPWLLILGFGGILFTWLGAGLLFIGQHGYATG